MTLSQETIFKRLKAVFPAPAHILLAQVRNGTGYARSRTRTADAIAVSTYPSRGLWFAGIEIKSYLGDWRRELANAEKAEEIAKYCKYWYVAAPEGMIPKAELPETWGLIEVGEKAAKIEIKAPAVEAKNADTLLACSILRAFSDAYVSKAEVRDLAKKEAEELTKAMAYQFDSLKAKVEEFEKASGVQIANEWEHGDIGKAVKLIRDSRILWAGSQLAKLKADAQMIVDACDKLGLVV